MQLKRLAHPAVLILCLGLLYSLTVGRVPLGGPDSNTTVGLESRLDENELKVALAPSEIPVPLLPEIPVASVEPQEEVPEAQPAVPPAPAVAPAPTPKVGELANVGGPTPEETRGEPAPRPQVYTHTVRSGETLSDIAKSYGIDIDTILAANSIADPNRIRVGEQLSVPNVKGVLHEVKRGESLWDIARAYGVSMADIVSANEIRNPDSIRIGERLVVPGAQAIVAMRAREAVVSANGQLLRNFSWPVTGRISSRFGPRWGRMHEGLDIAVPIGTPVRAAAAGRVTFSGDNGGYGLLVIIDHGDGVETRYAHNDRLIVRAGQQVARGDLIAYSGNTGNSTGPHVHFEIRRHGRALDPLDFLR